MLQIVFPGPVNNGALNKELEGLRLPGFIGTGTFTRQLDADGKLVLGSDRRPIKVPRFVLIKSDALTAAQTVSVSQVVADHVPPPVVPIVREVVTELQAASTLDEVKAALIKRFS